MRLMLRLQKKLELLSLLILLRKIRESIILPMKRGKSPALMRCLMTKESFIRYREGKRQ